MYLYVYVDLYICASTIGLLLGCKFSHLSTILLTKINNINLIKKRV